VLGGEFDAAEALRYCPEDKEAGFILLCTARPRSAMRILTHQRDAMRVHRLKAGLPTPRG
jgi:ferredoxin